MKKNDFQEKSIRTLLLRESTNKKIVKVDKETEELNLQKVLENSILFNFLLEFATKSYCEENILFMKEARLFRMDFNNINHDEQLLRAKEIYSKFFQTNAKYELNLNYETRLGVEKELEKSNISLEIFKAAEEEVYSLIDVDLFLKFQSNSIYSQVKEIYDKICKMSSCLVKTSEIKNEKKLAYWKDVIFSNIEPYEARVDEYLIHQNEPSLYLYYIFAGEVKVTKFIKNANNEEEEYEIVRLSDDQIFGEMSFLGQLNCTANVIATTPSMIKKIKYKHLLNILYANSNLSLLFFHSMGFHLANILYRNTSHFKFLDSSSHSLHFSPSLHSLSLSTPLDITPRSSSNLYNNDEEMLQKFLKLFPELSNSYLMLLSHQKCAIVKRHFQYKCKLFITKSFICYSSSFFSHTFRDTFYYSQINSISMQQRQLKFQFENKPNIKLSFKTDEITRQTHDLISSIISTHPDNNLRDRRESLPLPILDDKFQMNASDWDEILKLSNSQVVQFEKDDVIIHQGQSDFNLLAQIVKGKCRVIKEKQKFGKTEAKLVGFAKKGEVIGELMFLTECTPTVSVIADEAVTMVVLHGAYIKANLFDANPALIVRFYRHLCSIIAKRISDSEKLLFSN